MTESDKRQEADDDINAKIDALNALQDGLRPPSDWVGDRLPPQFPDYLKPLFRRIYGKGLHEGLMYDEWAADIEPHDEALAKLIVLWQAALSGMDEWVAVVEQKYPGEPWMEDE